MRAGGAPFLTICARRPATSVFYLRGHGVDSALNARLQQGARQFFALPEADKLAVQMVHSPHFRGYNRAAAELTRGQPDWREQFDIGAERPALTLSDDTPRWALQGQTSGQRRCRR